MSDNAALENATRLERRIMRWTFCFPTNRWLWGFQKHATYICFHFGRVDGLICWRS